MRGEDKPYTLFPSGSSSMSDSSEETIDNPCMVAICSSTPGPKQSENVLSSFKSLSIIRQDNSSDSSGMGCMLDTDQPNDCTTTPKYPPKVTVTTTIVKTTPTEVNNSSTDEKSNDTDNICSNSRIDENLRVESELSPPANSSHSEIMRNFGNDTSFGSASVKQNSSNLGLLKVIENESNLALAGSTQNLRDLQFETDEKALPKNSFLLQKVSPSGKRGNIKEHDIQNDSGDESVNKDRQIPLYTNTNIQNFLSVIESGIMANKKRDINPKYRSSSKVEGGYSIISNSSSQPIVIDSLNDNANCTQFNDELKFSPSTSNLKSIEEKQRKSKKFFQNLIFGDDLKEESTDQSVLLDFTYTSDHSKLNSQSKTITKSAMIRNHTKRNMILKSSGKISSSKPSIKITNSSDGKTKDGRKTEYLSPINKYK